MKFKLALLVLLAAAAAFVAFSSIGSVKPKNKLRIVITEWPPWDLMQIAEERGYLKDEGVEIEFIKLTSNEDVLRAVEDGRADGAFLGLDMCVRLNSRGVSTKMVLVTDVSKGSEGVIARSEISNMQALKGKKIGVTVCACSFISLSEVLNRSGLKESDVEIVNLPEDTIVPSFEAHKVDAIAVWEPNLIVYAGRADAHKLIDSSEYPGLIMDGLAVTPETLKHRGKDVEALMRVWFRVVDEMKAGEQSLIERVAKIEGVSREQIEVVFSRMEMGTREVNRTIFGTKDTPGTGLDAARRNADLLFQFHQLPRKPEPASVWDQTLNRN